MQPPPLLFSLVISNEFVIKGPSVGAYRLLLESSGHPSCCSCCLVCLSLLITAVVVVQEFTLQKLNIETECQFDFAVRG